MKNKKLIESNISILFQGNFDYKILNQYIKKCKKILPNAEIVISTWKGQKCGDLIGCDVIVENEPIINRYFDKEDGYECNLERMLLTTTEGIKACTKKYVLKLRTDLDLCNKKFIKYFNKYNIITNNSFFLERVLLVNVGCIKLLTMQALPTPCIHLSDWVHFGTKIDLLKIWDIKYDINKMNDSFHSNNFLTNFEGNLDIIPSESVIWFSLIFGENLYSRELLSNNLYIKKYYEFISHNLIIIEPWKIKIKSSKYPINTKYNLLKTKYFNSFELINFYDFIEICAHNGYKFKINHWYSITGFLSKHYFLKKIFKNSKNFA